MELHTTPTDCIDLTPADLAVATWRPRAVVARPTPPPFDRDRCLMRFRRVTPVRGYGMVWDWTLASIGDTLTPAEAHFWFAAMTEGQRYQSPAQIEPTLLGLDYTRKISREEIRQRLTPRLDGVSPQLIGVLSNLLDPVGLIDLLLDRELHTSAGRPYYYPTHFQEQVVQGYTRHVRPYLDEVALAQVREAARAGIDPNLWTQNTPPSPEQHTAYRLAPVIGLHRELLVLVSGWQDGMYRGSSRYNIATWWRQPHEMVFGLGEPWLVEQHMRRLALHLQTPAHARAWLAHTGHTALDWLVTSVAAVAEGSRPRLIETLCLVRAPAAARPLLELQVSGHGCPPLRGWFQCEVGNAVAGLLSVAAGRGKLTEAARVYLGEVKRRGFAEVIETQLATLEPAGRARIRELILDVQEAEYAPFDETATPAWLTQAFLRLPALPREDLPSWVDLDALPPLVIERQRLARGQVRSLLRAIQATPLEQSPPAVALAVRQHIAEEHREAFVWRLVDQWQGVGSPVRDALGLAAAGWLGGDGTASRLAALIREWARPATRTRASLALHALAAMGSHLALVHLASLARQVKTRKLRETAQYLLHQIAARQGESVERLEERAVPTLGFDGSTGPVYDFGPRRFQAVLAAGPRLMVRDGEGKMRTELPTIGARDDRDQARRATTSWRELKKQLREVLREQSHWMERSMVAGRRWPLAWLESHVLKHPLLSQLARLVLWGGYRDRPLTTTFRINEDGRYVDADEAQVRLTDLTSIRIVHPVEMSDAARARWSQVWSDHELIPPFAQLGRRLFSLDAAQSAAKAMTWFAGRRIPALTIASVTKAQEWLPTWLGEDQRNGQTHYKTFARSSLTAVLHHPDVNGHYPDPSAEQELREVMFLRGTAPVTAQVRPRREEAVAVGAVDALVYSEVCELLALLWAKGKE